MFRTTVTCLLLIFAAGIFSSVVHGQDSVPTIDEIVAAARQRQEAVKSGKFEWTVEEWTKKGWTTHPADRSPIPPEDTDATHERTLLFSGQNVRYESFGPQWNDAKKAFTPFRLTTTWNGKESYLFQDPEGFRNGGIAETPFFESLHTFEPIGWTLRMLDANWSTFDIHTFTVRAALEEVDGERCVVLEKSTPSQATPDRPMFDRLWLSRDRQYVARKYESGRAATIFMRLEIDYESDPTGLLAPIRWTKIEGEPDAPYRISHCEVASYELNSPIDPESFALTFPADTWVYEHGVKDPYIVRADGSHRTVTEAELKRGATWSDLVATPSGKAKLTPLKENSSVKWFWAIQIILGLVIVLLIYRRRRAAHVR